MPHRNVHDVAPSITHLIRRLRAKDAGHYLYRGQNGLFGPRGDFSRQIPSVYRDCKSPEDVEARLERCHLQVAWLFDRVRRNARLSPEDTKYSWDLDFAAEHLGDLDRPASPASMLGIAQHYGIATETLDLTHLDPAAVFATQRWLRLREAVNLPPGSSVVVQAGTEVGVIYRYDMRRLLELGVTVGDISSGNGGSRPILQEARLIALRYGQDVDLLDADAYEVFPFSQAGPYTYGRPIRPSPLLNEDQQHAVELATEYIPTGPSGRRSRSVSMRDLALPSFYVAAAPYNPQSWETYLGERPDPFLALAFACEEELPEVTDFEFVREYAKLLFGEWFGKSLIDHPSQRRFLELERERQAGAPVSSSRNTSSVRLAPKEKERPFRDVDDGPSMIQVPSGSFRMGSDSASHMMYRDEMPARECVIARAFAVGIRPITFSEMAVFGKESGLVSHAHIDFLVLQAKSRPLIPAVMTSWHDANAYCFWLSQRTGREYRLLTEMEWEYVCRAGTRTNYWWGDEFDPSRANTRSSDVDLRTITPPSVFQEGATHLDLLVPVDAYGPNPWGVYDMHGNAWEWVEDIYRDASIDPGIWVPRLARTEGTFRVLRGGSWMDPPQSLRSAVRGWAAASARDRVISFRVARSLDSHS